jgi:hypothetical protein
VAKSHGICFGESKDSIDLLRQYLLNPQIWRYFDLLFAFMASGIIYLIILGMWVAYFLPQWLMNHEVKSGKSIDRYKNAMAVVAEQHSIAGHKVTEISSFESLTESGLNQNSSGKFFQRRLIFVTLLSTQAIALVGGSLALLDWSISALPATGLLIFVFHVRRAAHKSQERIRKLKAIEKITYANLITAENELIDTVNQIADSRIQNKYREETAEIARKAVTVVAKAGASWQPNTIPKPTYTTAPKAITPKRAVDQAAGLSSKQPLWQSEQELIDQLLDQKQKPKSLQPDLFDQKQSGSAVNE